MTLFVNRKGLNDEKKGMNDNFAVGFYHSGSI